MRRTIKRVLENSPCFLLIALAIGLRLHGQTAIEPTGEFNQRFWQARDGLPFSSVQAMVQSPDGYLWIGTSGGLIRFDGWTFDLFNHSSDPAFQDDSVLSLAVERDGTLWIGTEGGGLVRYHKGAFQHFGKEAGFTNQFVRALYVDSDDGSLWVGTDHGVYKGNVLAGVRRLDDIEGLPSMNVLTIVGGRDGTRYVGGLDLLTVGKSRTRYFISRRRFGYEFAFSICQTRDGTLWVGTSSKLRKLSLQDRGNIYSQAHSVPVPPPPNLFNRNSSELASQFQRGLIYSAMVEASDGSLWIGTDGEGLLRWKDGRFRWFRSPEYLPSNHITSIIEDAQKDIWVGTTSGLARMKPTPAKFVELPNGMPVNVRTVSNDRDSVFVSTVEGQLLRPSGGVLTKVLRPSRAQSIVIRTTFRDREGTLWIGTAGRGLFGYGPDGTIHRYPQVDLTRAFAETPDGRLWIGADGGLWTIEKGEATQFGTENGSFRALAVDGGGVLWAGSDYGLLRIRDGRVLHDNALNALRSLKIWSLFIDREGAVWIGTRGAGLYIWESGKLHHYEYSSGFPSDSIYTVLEDRFHQIWLSGSNGVWSIDREALVAAADSPTFAAAIHSFGSADVAMNGGFQPAGILTPSGDLQFATSIGTLNVHPDRPTRPQSFPLVIKQIREDGSRVDTKSPVIIRASVRRIEIDYSATRLDSPEQTRFRYMLDGLEPRWTNAESLRTAVYTHVPPGHYVFRVQAVDPAAPNQIVEAEIQVQFKPHFYQTIWFFMLCAALVLSVTGVAFLLHERRRQERFDLVLKERNRVARELHDTIIQGCIGISTLLEAAKSTEESLPETSRSLVQRARIQVMIIVEQARQAVWNLRHDAPPEQIFGSALGVLVAELQQAGELPISVKIDGSLPFMSASVRNIILLIVREALLNAIQHAQASHIQLFVHFGGRKLTIKVSDDGLGFHPKTGDGLHFGIIGMRERAEGLGGRCVVASSGSQGTTLELTIPRAKLSAEFLERAS